MSDIKNRTVWLLSLFCLMLALSSISCAMNTSEASQNSILIKQLTGFPDEESGIRQGVSACYAGILDGKMVMAGGCNFPKTPVSEGGEKRFYKGVYLADIPQGEDTLLIWHKAGELPVQSAYGVSLTLPDGIICIGGTDGTTPLTSVYILRINSGRITIEYLPSLPSPLDNMGGALHGDTIYVAGGNLSGEPSNHLFMLDKKRPLSGWKELTPFPGYPRVQPVCAMQKLGREAYLYIWGGFAPAVKDNSATLTTSGYRYSITRKTW
ncbi:MAG: cyclically-permuted mutarotase family protein, partial [Bacteroidales bacterium]